MEKEIIARANMTRYSTANHVEFHKLGAGICVKYAAAIGSQSLIDGYEAAVVKESEVFKWIRRSEFTQKKIQADRRRDDLYRGLAETVKANLRHFDPQAYNAACHVDNLLKGYGDVVHLNYDAETASIDSVVVLLRSDSFVDDAQLLRLTPWINELEIANNEFKQYVSKTAQEEIDRPDVSPKESRRRSDVALRLIIDRVDAMITLNGDAALTGFLAEYNTLAKHYNTLINEHYGRIHIRTDIAGATIAAIPPQPFNGQPVYAIPEVSLRSTAPDGSEKVVRLVFITDFTVGYKNNFQPGTATLTVVGLGNYKGEVVTTFNIVIND
ncbi:MAG: DUF6261 family protein [Prevotellaceae bacterium]|jgi:hypothetical protein|nr:DUF6261 family protein [Prevotellaceae bacterium]